MKKKVLLLAVTFVICLTINFFLPRLMSGDSFSYTSSDSGQDVESFTKEQKEELMAYYGLDKPVGEQFLTFLKNLVTLDFGESIRFKRPVSGVIGERLLYSLNLILASSIISLFLGLFLTFASLKRRNSTVFGIMSVLEEIPSFVIGTALLFFSAKFLPLPISGSYTPFLTHPSFISKFFDVSLHSVLPVTTLVLISLPSSYFISRNSCLSALDKKYVLQGENKGISKPMIFSRYILLNSLGPILTKFLMSFGGILSATIIVENIFAYGGIGLTLKEGVLTRDFPLISGIFFFSTLLILAASFLSTLASEKLESTK